MAFSAASASKASQKWRLRNAGPTVEPCVRPCQRPTTYRAPSGMMTSYTWPFIESVAPWREKVNFFDHLLRSFHPCAALRATCKRVCYVSSGVGGPRQGSPLLLPSPDRHRMPARERVSGSGVPKYLVSTINIVRKALRSLHLQRRDACFGAGYLHSRQVSPTPHEHEHEPQTASLIWQLCGTASNPGLVHRDRPGPGLELTIFA